MRGPSDSYYDSGSFSAGVENLLNLWATSSSNKVPADHHHSSGSKKSLRKKFGPSFSRIDGDDQKKVFARDENHFGGFIGAYLSLKMQKVPSRARIKDCAPNKMPSRAVDC